MTNGFGGGLLGGLVYYLLTSSFANTGVSFPANQVLIISLFLTTLDVARLTWQSPEPETAPAR
jgi:hypothetical protein